MTRWRPIAAMLLSLCGLGLATYLTYIHYTNPNAIGGTCVLGGVGHGAVNCAAVTESAQSMILGLPVALYGAVFFLFMVAINLPAAWRSPSAWVARLRLAAAVAGIGMVVYLISMETLVIHHICIDCTMVHVVQFALFLLIVTGWEDTGWAALGWEEEEDVGNEDLLAEEAEPLPAPPKGDRPPRGKARKQAGVIRA